MHKIYIAIFVIYSALVSGCANLERNEKSQQEAYQRYSVSESKRYYTCLSKQECEKAFRITKAYIIENSSMNVQLSDDVFIATYRPHKKQFVGLKAIRKPVEAEIEQITLTAECNDYTYGGVGYCYNKVAVIYEDFVPYINNRMK